MTITLNQLINQVREELLTPTVADTPERMYPFLFVDEVEIELSVTVSAAADGSGKVTIKVVEVGAGVQIGREEVQKITVKLSPLLGKEDTLKQLEEKLGPRIMKKVEETSVRGATKEF